MHTLMDQPVPRFSFCEIEGSITECAPLPMKCRATVATTEVRLHRFFKATAEDHSGLGLSLTPAIKITIAITARAAEVLGYLGIAKVHFGYSPSPPGWLMHSRSFPTPFPVQTNRDFGRSGR